MQGVRHRLWRLVPFSCSFHLSSVFFFHLSSSFQSGFTIPLERITGSFCDKTRANELHIAALVPKTLLDTALVQADFVLRCSDEEEVNEWVETLQSVVTDRNIRAMNEQRQVHFDDAFVALQSSESDPFPFLL